MFESVFRSMFESVFRSVLGSGGYLWCEDERGCVDVFALGPMAQCCGVRMNEDVWSVHRKMYA